MLTGADVTALGLLCDSWAAYEACRAIVQREGRVIEVDGIPKRHPVDRIMAETWERTVSMMREFGLTPSSRSRVSALKSDEPENPFDQF
ncbi:MAG: phage terminase small subunit P27 family [Nitrospinae bacterium]|nr:phage terminase small subunit P27 family [Nitrospinota bacterium]